MDKKIIVVILLIIIIVGAFFLTKSDNKKMDSNINQSSTPVVPTLTTVSELKIEDIEVGSGSAVVKSGDTITAHYTGALTDGTKFDSSVDRGQPFTTEIGVGRVIKGWDEGIIGMKIGGKRKLTIPGDMGYGPQGSPPAIPSNATLIFDIELLDIK